MFPTIVLRVLMAVCILEFALLFISHSLLWKIPTEMENVNNFIKNAVAQPNEKVSYLPLPPHSYPVPGSADYRSHCAWVKPSNADCYFLATPSAGTGEGIAQWMSQVVTGFLLAQQTGCRFVLDYTGAVEVNEVLLPTEFNWTVPEHLKGSGCFRMENCVPVPMTAQYSVDKWNEHYSWELEAAPFYRQYYTPLFQPNEAALAKKLSGFKVQYGMACAMSSLFQLNPQAIQYEQKLPQLLSRPHDALTIALYVRTGLTDLRLKKNEEAVEKAERTNAEHAESHTRCVLKLESQHLTAKHTSVIWLVVSDSPALKAAVHKKFDGTTVRRRPRNVRTSSAAGRHSRPTAVPSTANFVLAVTDWFVIGQADLVVASTFSFGRTAALRTARSVYDIHSCQAVVVPWYLQNATKMSQTASNSKGVLEQQP